MVYDTRLAPLSITIDYIRTFVSDIEIYSYYAGFKLHIDTPVISPLRQDNNPSFTIFNSTSGGVMYKDFGTGDSGNVVKFVQEHEHISYREALKRIWHDLILIKKPNRRAATTEQAVKKAKVIEVKRKNFTETDDAYWNTFGITRDILKKYNVAPISAYWIDGELKSLQYTKDSPMYAYRIFSKFKIYRPNSPTRADKWRCNCTNLDIQGWEQLPTTGKTLLIAKSLKDVMTLYAMGYTAVAPHSESSNLPTQVLENLKQRFHTIITFYDNDEQGLMSGEKLAKLHGFKNIHIPVGDSKDISDYCRDHGIAAAKELIKQLITDAC